MTRRGDDMQPENQNMSTQTNTSPEVKPAITESDVLVFFQREAERIQKAHTGACKAVGLASPTATIRISARPVFYITAWGGRGPVTGCGETLAEAEADFVSAIVGHRTPAKLRAEAAEKLAEAEKLEAAISGGKEAVS